MLVGFLGFSVAAIQAQSSTSPVNAQLSPDSKTEAALPSSPESAAGTEDAQYSSSSTSNLDAVSSSTEAKLLPPTPMPAGTMKAEGDGAAGAGGAAGQYHRPHYHTGGNQDGSDRWVIYGGGGITEPIGNTKNYLTDNFAIQAGVGYQFNRKFSLPIEFDWDQFGMTKQNLDDQILIYDNVFGSGAVNGILNGNSHIWSFSFEPRYAFHASGSWSPYVVGGVGFYHKVANFTIPAALVGACGVYGGAYGGGYGGFGYGYGYGAFYGYCGGNLNIDHYTSNAPGFDGGAGISYRISDTRVSFYAEARYVYIDNSQKKGITMSNYTDTPYKTYDLYPENSYHTDYIPITFGIRF